MCRFLIVIGDAKIQAKALHAFHPVAKHGMVKPWEDPGHLDGWGIAVYGEQGIVKIANSAGDVDEESELYEEAIDRAVAAGGRMAMVHFRKATWGVIRVENTQPFTEGPWMFIHNGTVEEMQVLGPKPELIGTTDSEEFFRRWCAQGSPITSYPQWVEEVSQKCLTTSLTSVISDGLNVMAMRRVSLQSLKRSPEGFDPMPLAHSYTLYHWNEGNAHVVASEPLSKSLPGKWRALDNGEALLLST